MVTLKPGERVRVVPHPSDSWTCQSWNGMVTSTWSGTDADTNSIDFFSFTIPYSRFRFGELLVQVDKGDVQRCGVVNGPGNLWMMPNRPNGKNTGEIRIKLVPVDDE